MCLRQCPQHRLCTCKLFIAAAGASSCVDNPVVWRVYQHLLFLLFIFMRTHSKAPQTFDTITTAKNLTAHKLRTPTCHRPRCSTSVNVLQAPQRAEQLGVSHDTTLDLTNTSTQHTRLLILFPYLSHFFLLMRSYGRFAYVYSSSQLCTLHCITCRASECP